jgi:two-component system, chemotaxis family, CheB/CheR fusion protein
LYGYRREEVLGKRKEHLLKTNIPGSSLDEVRAVLLRTGSWSGLLRHTNKSGHVLKVPTHIQLERLDGRQFVLETVRGAVEREN